MKKKLIAVFAAVVVSASAGLFATGIGPQLNFDPVATRFITPPAWGFACSAKFDNIPLYFAGIFDIAPHFYKDDDGAVVATARLGLQVTADYWFMNPEIIGLWRWFWGVGGAVRTDFTANGKNFYLSTGPRVLAGMNWHFADGFLELYVQQAIQPELQFAFGEDGKANGVFYIPVYFPSSVGLRFWF